MEPDPFISNHGRPNPLKLDRFIDNHGDGARTRSKKTLSTRKPKSSNQGTFIFESERERFDFGTRAVLCDETLPDYLQPSSPDALRSVSPTRRIEAAASAISELRGNPVVLDRPSLHMFGVYNPPIRKATPPDSADGNKFLMTPLQRRQLLGYEVSNQRAQQKIKEHVKEATLLLKNMQNRYPRGLSEQETPETIGSIIYHSGHDRQERDQRKEFTSSTRLEKLSMKGSSQVGYDVLSHLESTDPKAYPPEHMFVHRRPCERNAFQESESVHDEYKLRPARTQNLRNVETNGRVYDVFGQEVYVIPPNIEERINHRRTHPSIIFAS